MSVYCACATVRTAVHSDWVAIEHGAQPLANGVIITCPSKALRTSVNFKRRTCGKAWGVLQVPVSILIILINMSTVPVVGAVLSIQTVSNCKRTTVSAVLLQ